MTNEELAIKAKNHDPNALLMLWESLSRWIRTKASRYLYTNEDQVKIEFDDLAQEGFLAMYDAVDKFDPDRGVKFTTYLDFFLRKRFDEASGNQYASNSTGIKRSDPLRLAESLNIPIGDEDDTSLELIDVCPDRDAEYAFLLVDYNGLVCYAEGLVKAAIDGLTPQQKDAIYHCYYKRPPRFPATRQAEQDRLQRAFHMLRVGKYRRELRDTLECFKDFEAMGWVEYYRLAERRALMK